MYILPQPARRVEFEERYRTRVIWQGWGMTEIFPHVPSKTRLENVSDDTIGPPLAWVDFGVVDEDDRMLAPGELGQMVYRPLFPYAMASGYYGDTAATSAAFRNFMFHTGDLGYYDESEYIHFVMRNQDAIRRRGENVSAVELENIARSHPRVVDAAAYAVPSPVGEHEVKLDVVSSDELPIDLDRLHQWLTENLPRFMVPRYLEQRKSLPKTPSQRVEKYKLALDPVDRQGVSELRAAGQGDRAGQRSLSPNMRASARRSPISSPESGPSGLYHSAVQFSAPEKSQHRGLEVELGIEYPLAAPVLDHRRHDQPVLATLLNDPLQVFPGQVTPLVKDHECALGVLGDDGDVTFYQRPEAFFGVTWPGHRRVSQCEELVDFGLDDLKEKGLLAVDVRIQASRSTPTAFAMSRIVVPV